MGKPEDLDDQEGWEREKQHIINPNAMVAPPPLKRRLTRTWCQREDQATKNLSTPSRFRGCEAVAREYCVRRRTGTLEKVGIKVGGKFKSPVNNQLFDTQKALDLHLKYLHDPKKCN